VRRGPTFYRVILALPAVMLAYLIWSGRWSQWQALPSADWFVTCLLWFASLAPLLWTAGSLGRQHVVARRMGYSWVIGLREVLRRAAGGPIPGDSAPQFQLAPRDDPRNAALFGVGVGILVPVFFASFTPFLRTPRALIWLAGAGVLFGVGTYARQRAMAYLRDEPGQWAIGRAWSLLNPERYDEAGRHFVRMQIVLMMLLAIWWIGGVMMLVSR